jgi:hypothetical protein
MEQLAHVDFLTQYSGGLVAALFALTGGMATQLKIVSQRKVPWTAVSSELILSALAGYTVYVTGRVKIADPEILWALSGIAGVPGSLTIRALSTKYLPGLYGEAPAPKEERKKKGG